MSATSTTDFNARPSGRAPTFWSRLRTGDDIAYVITVTSALTILAITALLVFELFTSSAAPRHQFGWSFLTTSIWDPVGERFGALPFIYGTVVTSGLAL